MDIAIVSAVADSVSTSHTHMHTPTHTGIQNTRRTPLFPARPLQLSRRVRASGEPAQL